MNEYQLNFTGKEIDERLGAFETVGGNTQIKQENMPESLRFGEKTTYGDTLTWDGNTEGLEFGTKVDTFNNVSLNYYRISESTPSFDDFVFHPTQWKYVDGTVIEPEKIEDGEWAGYYTVAYEYKGDKMLTLNYEGAFVVYEDNVIVEDSTIKYIFPKKGFYVVSYFDDSPSENFVSLTINNYNGFETTETVPLPNKYLDIIETVGGDTLTWDGDTSGLYSINLGVDAYCISSVVPTKEDCANGITFTMSDGSQQPFIGATVQNIFADDGFANLDFVIIIPADNYTMEGVTFAKKGVYTFVGAMQSLTINGYTGFTKEQVKEEYLPSGATVFYMGSDESDVYLYADKDCTVKATKEEVKKALNGVMYVYCDGAYIPPINIMDFSTHWGLIILLYYGGSTIPTELYTAEYTG